MMEDMDEAFEKFTEECRKSYDESDGAYSGKRYANGELFLVHVLGSSCTWQQWC